MSNVDFQNICIMNLLWPSYVIWQHRYVQTLAQVIDDTKVLHVTTAWDHFFTVSAQANILDNEFENTLSKLVPHLSGSNELFHKHFVKWVFAITSAHIHIVWEIMYLIPLANKLCS